MTASCNPLSADEILSITVPINARCSSEIEARPSRIFSSSGRAPDGAGLVLWPLSKAGRGELRGAAQPPSAPAGFGETLRDDTSGSPASLGGTAGGGVPLSIISGRRSPEDELCCEGLRSELQGKISVNLLRYKSRISLIPQKENLSLLTARWRADPLEGVVRPRNSPASDPLTRIFSPVSRPWFPGPF